MIKKNNQDTVIDEIHKTRREIAEKFGNDITAIADDARMRQAASGRAVWLRKPRNSSEANEIDFLPDQPE